MIEDYETLEKIGDLAQLVTVVWTKYRPYIYKRAIQCEYVSKGRILREDFASDVYLKLFYFLGRIDIQKIKEKESFSFFIFVSQAATRVLDNSIKKDRKESVCLNCEKYENSVEYRDEENLFFNLEEYLSQLTERQRTIVNDRMNRIHEKETLKKLKISHGTYCAEIIKSRNKLKEIV
jgi:hypothetical protein